MSGFEVSDSVRRNPLVFLQRATLDGPMPDPAGIHLKCPQCLSETVLHRRVTMYDIIRCETCGSRSEMRQLHEAWCLAQARE